MTSPEVTRASQEGFQAAQAQAAKSVAAPLGTVQPNTSVAATTLPQRPTSGVGSFAETNRLLGGEYFDPVTGRQLQPFTPTTAGGQGAVSGGGAVSPTGEVPIAQPGAESFEGLLADFGIGGAKTFEDVITGIAKTFGLPDVEAELAKVDSQFAEDQAEVNNNPWISEAQRSRKITQLKEKYETKKDQLVDRLKLRGDIVGKALDVFEKEREFRKDMLFKRLDLRQKELEQSAKVPSDIQTFKAFFPSVNITTPAGQKAYLDWKAQEAAAGRKPEGELSALVTAVLTNPAVYDTLTPTLKAAILPDLTTLGFQYQGKPLSAEAQKVKENAESGLRAISTLENEITQGGKLRLVQAAVPFGLGGARILRTARNEIADVITRLRTGAALNEQEQAFYKRQMPSALDSGATIKYKLDLFRQLFQRLSGSNVQISVKGVISATSKDSDYIKSLNLK